MPKINCPFCNQSYDVEPEIIGQKVQCAVCKEPFVALQQEASNPQVEQQSIVQQETSLEKEPSKSQTHNKVEVHFPSNGTNKCPYCKKEVEPDAVTCPYCHGSFYSKNPVKNAIITIIVFVIAYLLISHLVDCEADREMDKAYEKSEQEMEKIYQEAEREMGKLSKKYE